MFEISQVNTFSILRLCVQYGCGPTSSDNMLSIRPFGMSAGQAAEFQYLFMSLSGRRLSFFFYLRFVFCRILHKKVTHCGRSIVLETSRDKSLMSLSHGGNYIW